MDSRVHTSQSLGFFSNENKQRQNLWTLIYTCIHILKHNLNHQITYLCFYSDPSNIIKERKMLKILWTFHYPRNSWLFLYLEKWPKFGLVGSSKDPLFSFNSIQTLFDALLLKSYHSGYKSKDSYCILRKKNHIWRQITFTSKSQDSHRFFYTFCIKSNDWSDFSWRESP